jgi:hypothetical protein
MTYGHAKNMENLKSKIHKLVSKENNKDLIFRKVINTLKTNDTSLTAYVYDILDGLKYLKRY